MFIKSTFPAPIVAFPKHIGLIFILWSSIPIYVFSQSPVADELKNYQEAVGAKNYSKASQYAYAIANHYGEQKDLTKAIDYAGQAVTHAKKTKDIPLQYSVFHLLGSYNLEAKKHTKALENFQSALSAATKLNDTLLIQGELINISVSYGYLERFKKSIEFAEEALSLAIINHDTSVQQKCYHLLTEYYARQGNKKKSNEYQAQLALLLSSQQQATLNNRKITALEQHLENVGQENRATQSRLSAESKKLQQTNASLRHVESSLQAATDSLLITADSLKAVEAVSKNRQMEIELLQKGKELADIRIKEQEVRIQNEALIRNSIMVGTLLSVALVAVLIISYRKKTKDNKKIAQQNKNIKSSINYAKRIQEAMLPKVEQCPHVFEHSFILFKPRDTVSGDFYWFADLNPNDQESSVVFAAIDCTGHGVPGAFMSMIGINALNSLVNRGVTASNSLLESLDHEIRTALRQDTTGNNDGMDVALCVYRRREKILEFAGAKNPLVYIQNNELVVLKGDSHSIGGRRRPEGKSHHFTKHEIRIDKPTTIYLYSDGYKHQFGGKANSKFSSKNLNNLLLEIHPLPMDEQKTVLQKTIEEWKGTREQTDDILVMGLKLH